MFVSPHLSVASEPLRALARSIFDARDDLRAHFSDPESPEFGRWLGTYGLAEHPDVAALFPPLPPDTLRATACGGPTIETHLNTGAADFSTVVDLYEIYSGRSASELGSVLDFGCGCGRLLRWFSSSLPRTALFGTDVREATIRWCDENLEGTFLLNEVTPPQAIEADTLDLSVALSVFSHLDREQSIAWMSELARVTKPDGLILVTTHGAFSLGVLTRSAEHQSVLEIDAPQAQDMLRRLQTEGFLHKVLSKATLERADGVDDNYGQAFMTEAFAREGWGEFVEVVGYVPVGLNLFQDVFVLRPR